MIATSALSQTMTLYCKGIEENFYEQNPQLNESHKDTREYKFIKGKLDGRKTVKWSEDKIFYECENGVGEGCSVFKNPPIITFRQIEISRNSGEVTEYGNASGSEKLNISDTKSKFKGICTKVESKKF